MSDLQQIDLPGSAGELIAACETVCVAGCCGIDAFNFGKDTVGQWLSGAGLNKGVEARNELQQCLDRLASSADWVDVSAIEDPTSRVEVAKWVFRVLEVLHECGIERDPAWREPIIPPVAGLPPWGLPARSLVDPEYNRKCSG